MTIQVGTIIHATLRNEDLLPRFLDLLEEHASKVSVKEECAMIRREMEIPGYWDGEVGVPDPMDSIEWAIEKLNDLCPPGVFFGTHPGDGSDFGFWREES